MKAINTLVVFMVILYPFCLLPEEQEEQEERKEQLRYLILDIHVAASNSNFEDLKRMLPPVFKYSFGGNDLREGAIKYYKNNPDKLKNLASVLEAGCRMQGEYYSSCPPQEGGKTVIYFGPRAGFEFDKKSKKWIFRYFVEGD